MHFPKEKTNVAQRVHVEIEMDEPQGTLIGVDAAGQELWHDTLPNIDRFIGATVAYMLAELAKVLPLRGGELTDFLISNRKHCDTSYNPDLADNGIYEEIDPLVFKKVEPDTIIEALDTIAALFVFYAEDEAAQPEAPEIETPAVHQYCSYNPFSNRYETYQEWMERQNYIPPTNNG